MTSPSNNGRLQSFYVKSARIPHLGILKINIINKIITIMLENNNDNVSTFYNIII